MVNLYIFLKNIKFKECEGRENTLIQLFFNLAKAARIYKMINEKHQKVIN